MKESRRKGKTELVFFVNAGDPSLDVTYEILKVLARKGVVAVELCVPFSKSVTDGRLIRESHERALNNGTDFTMALELARKARDELGLSIVLLSDYGFTVKPRGMEKFLDSCANAGVSATLLHNLPPILRKNYVRYSEQIGLGRIMSCFAGSDETIRASAYRESSGFIYIVSRFGRTGSRVNFGADVLAQIAVIRAETEQPLAVGFGVQTIDDVMALRSCGADAVVIGSAATAVVERNLGVPDQIPAEFEKLAGYFMSGCSSDKHGNISL